MERRGRCSEGCLRGFRLYKEVLWGLPSGDASLKTRKTPVEGKIDLAGKSSDKRRKPTQIPRS